MIARILALKAEGLSYAEIGARIGLSRNQVAGLLFRHNHDGAKKTGRGRRPPAADVMKRGEAHPCAKLTEEDVRFIRTTPSGERGVAKRFRVAHSVVHDVRARRTWAHVV